MNATELNVELFDGTKVPALALGTWTYNDDPDDRVNNAVKAAIEAKYRHIDTAHVYRDEDRVGDVLKDHPSMFITTKLFNNELDAAGVHKGIEKSLKALKRDKLDLVLIHWPAKPDGPSLKETWTALEDEVTKGRVKHIGVSNFNRKRIEEILSFCKIQPAVNQIELHLYLQQIDFCEWLKHKKIAVMSYMPFGNTNGTSNNKNAQNTGPLMVEDPKLKALAQKLNSTPHAICLGWCLARKYIVAVGSRNPDHVKANVTVPIVNGETLKELEALDKGKRYNDLEKALGLQDLWS